MTQARMDGAEVDRMAYNKGYTGSKLRDIGLIGLGTAVGGGLGWLAGDSLARAVMKSSPGIAATLRYAVPVASAVTAGYVGHLDARRRALEEERADMAGRLEQHELRQRVAVRGLLAKTARILTSPAEWTEGEKATGVGVGAGAAGAMAIGGLTSLKPTFAKFALPGAVIGGYLGYRRHKKAMQAQGYT
jgi:hypothetical protein